MRCKWPFCRDEEGDNRFPVRLRLEFGSKARIAEPQSFKKRSERPEQRGLSNNRRLRFPGLEASDEIGLSKR
ncbi:hypothetical protein SAMN04487969_10540 [Paenibacillus algorifonticola]|uniref:Uncharacterized protein n=1 Tax=Paenibacillus algorifonticola TaxID=684063 RepID=A0A1I2CGM9_9BACL|nr:hypothetical protein SAMN04487969_10540 [Paenibacillus algorifonticola]